jgi:hypothetical protein
MRLRDLVPSPCSNSQRPTVPVTMHPRLICANVVGVNRALQCPHCKKGRVVLGPHRECGLCETCRTLVQYSQPPGTPITRRDWLAGAGSIAGILSFGFTVANRIWPNLGRQSLVHSIGGTASGKGSASIQLTIIRPEAASLRIIGHKPDVVITTAPTVLHRVRDRSLIPNLSIGLRRSLWRARRHPRAKCALSTGRLRWKQRRFPKAPDLWMV